MGDGDGWVQCAAGHRHWGRFGAAGLLLRDDDSTVLQHRAPWTHEGDTWGLPGGARDSHEDPVETALREAVEEAGIDPAAVEPLALVVDDHIGWSYTTVLARPRVPVDPHAANAESTDVRWWRDDLVDALPLHRGLRATWPRLRDRPSRVVIVVESRPAADEAAFWAGLVTLVRAGVSTRLLPGDPGGPERTALPDIRVAGDASDRPPDGAAAAAWWRAKIMLGSVTGSVARADTQFVIVSDERGRPPESGAAIVGSDWLSLARQP